MIGEFDEAGFGLAAVQAEGFRKLPADRRQRARSGETRRGFRFQAKHDVFQHGQARNQAEMLMHHADAKL